MTPDDACDTYCGQCRNLGICAGRACILEVRPGVPSPAAHSPRRRAIENAITGAAILTPFGLSAASLYLSGAF